MSIFDPYKIYDRKQYSTHKGQVIQKRPTKILNPSISPEQIQDAYDTLTGLGYYVSPQPPLPTPTDIRFFSLQSFETPNTNSYSVYVRDVLRAFYNAYSTNSIWELSPNEVVINLSIPALLVQPYTNSSVGTNYPAQVSVQFTSFETFNNFSVTTYHYTALHSYTNFYIGQGIVGMEYNNSYQLFNSSQSGVIEYASQQSSPRSNLFSITANDVGTFNAMISGDWSDSAVPDTLKVSQIANSRGTIQSVCHVANLCILVKS